MIKRKNWIHLIAISIILIMSTWFMVNSKWIDITKIIALGNDLQYNLISTSATLGGFLFTGISILISVIEKDRIKRLWENHYLDNMYRTAIIGICTNVLTIGASLITLWSTITDECLPLLVKIEIFTTILSLIYFVWCVADLVYVLGRIISNVQAQ